MIIKKQKEIKKIADNVLKKIQHRFKGTSFRLKNEKNNGEYHYYILIGDEAIFYSGEFSEKTKDIFNEYILEKKIYNLHFVLDTTFIRR